MTLPLDTWRAIIGFPPWQFWQFGQAPGGNPASIDSKCSPLVFEYDWQGSDAAGRESIRMAIADAEWKMLDYLGYRVAPEYVTDAVVDWPRYYEANLSRSWDFDATWRRVAVSAPEGYIQAMGVEQLTLIGSATVLGGTLVYSALFNAGLEDTFTITLPTTVTDATQIALYFSAGDRFDDTTVSDRWRIEPIDVTISGGNVIITGRKWLVARPILYQNPIATMLNPATAANFVTSLDVYQRTTNGNGLTTTTAQATLVYETNDCGACWGLCCCGSGTSSSDPNMVGEVIARAGIRNAELGLITPAAATYNATTGLWSSAWCCAGAYCDPDRVKLRYLAGFPLEGRQMARRFRDPTAWLAAAELKRRICACRETNERLHDLQQDLTLESTQSERYVVPESSLTNPFGTRRGHVQAWRAVQDVILRRGVSA